LMALWPSSSLRATTTDPRGLVRWTILDEGAQGVGIEVIG
jgi:hypothetical protein